VSVFLPQSGWAAYGSGGWRYTGSDPNGPISRVTVRVDSIAVKGGKANWAYTLAEPSQGSVAVRLRLGSGAIWCANAPARLSGNPPSSARSDKPGRFLGQPNSAAPGSCPPTP
jgi:hypothetical protein